MALSTGARHAQALPRRASAYHLRADARPTYYDIKFRKPNDREIRRLLLADAIADVHARSWSTYGILRVKAALAIEQGLIVNTKGGVPVTV